MVALLSDDDVGADEIREVCESQEDSCKIEVCREGKVGEVDGLPRPAIPVAQFLRGRFCLTIQAISRQTTAGRKSSCITN